MGQQLSWAAEGQESSANYTAQNSDTTIDRSQSQRDPYQGQSQSFSSGLSEQNSNVMPPRQLGSRKNVVSKESPPTAIPVVSTSSPPVSAATAAAGLVCRASRHETDLGRMSVREAIDSFIESRLSAPNDSPPPPKVSTSLGVRGLKNEDSRSSCKPGEDSTDKTGNDRINGMEARDLSVGTSKSAIYDSNQSDTPQTGADSKENSTTTNDALDEENGRMSDRELVIVCDATESPQAATGKIESLPSSKDREEGGVAFKNSSDNLSPICLSETKDVKDEDTNKTARDEEKKNSPSAKEEKQTFSSYLQDRLKAQLATHVDTEAQGHLYLWDVNKSNVTSNAPPVSSTVTRTGSVRLQTLIDKVLDQSIGRGLCESPTESESSHLFVPVKLSSESSSSPSDNNKSTEQSPSSHLCPNKTQNSLVKQGMNSLCFKDHIEKVVVENFLSYEEEGEGLKSDSRQKREESTAIAGHNPASMPNSESDSGKAKREMGGVGPDGTVSVQHIVDRVISQTEVISKLLTPGAADQTSERMSPGRGSGGHAVSSSSPNSVSSAPARTGPGSHVSSEGQPTGGNSGQPSIGRKRGRPRLSSPVSRPNTWSGDRNPSSVGDRSNAVFRDPQTGDYRATSSSYLHGRQGGPSIPAKPHPRLAQGQGPPPIDMIASQGSIQHGLPIGALVPQQPATHMYHSQLHPHHPHVQHPSSDNPNSSVRPILTSSVPPPHSPHLTSYHQRGLHHAGPHGHGPQPPSPHGHSQHHQRPPDHLANHHPSHNKPLPPLIHANHIQERHVVVNNSTSVASGSSGGSRLSNGGSVGSNRLVPVSHIPTASCSCPNCIAIYSRDKLPQVPPSSHHQQHNIRRSEAGIPSHLPSSKLPDARRDDLRSHPHHPQPYAVYENANALASRGEHLTAGAPETLNPVVAVGSKVIPPAAVIPSFIATRRPVGLPPALDHHSREEQQYLRDDKSAHYPYSPQGKPTSSDVSYPEDERYRGWQRAQTSGPHSSQTTLPYPPYDHPRKAPANGHGRQSPEKVSQQQPQPLNLQKSDYQHSEAPLASSSTTNADQPLDLSVKPSSSSEHKNQDQEVHRPPPTLRNEAFYQDPALGPRYLSAHVLQREPDPHDAFTDVDRAGRTAPGRPENAVDRPHHPVQAYPPNHRAFQGPSPSHPLVPPYPQQACPKAPPLHPSQVYLPRGDSRGGTQALSERPPYPTSGHLLSPSNTVANSRESPTQRSRHPYPPYPLPPSSSSSSSSSPSLQLQQQSLQQAQHTAAAQPPSLSIPPHLRGTVGASSGNNTQYQRRSPYSDQARQPKHQDLRAPSPHYSSVGNHQKPPETPNYSALTGSQDTSEIRGVHTNLPPSHPQPGISPDEQDALKHSVSKHEPIQNIIGNHPQNDILYLICKLCRQTYGSPYGFRKHFRNQHGFEPKVEHTIVQTISATKTAMAHTSPADQPITDAEKKGILYSDVQGHQAGDVPISYKIKPEHSSSSLVIDKHSQDAAVAVVRVPDDHKAEPKAEGKEVDGKMEAVLENTKFLECPECGQTFQLNDFGSYKRHCRQHSVNQYSGPFSCHDCQKSFAEPGQLQQHLNTHKSFTPSLCGFCPTFFSSPHYLAVHLQAAHGHVVSSESLKTSSIEGDLKPEDKNEKLNTIDLHTMIENALMEINIPCSSQETNSIKSKSSSSSSHNVASSSSHHQRTTAVSSSIISLPLSKRHKMSMASSSSPVLTTVHTPKKLEVQKLPADAVVTTASPDSSYEEGKGQPAESQPRLSTTALKTGHADLVPSPSNCSNNSQSQGEAKESPHDSQDSNHSTASASGGAKKEENGCRTVQTDVPMSIDKIGSNKDDTESIASDRCHSVDSNSQSVGESRVSSPGCDDAEKFYKHKKYSRHRKRMSSSDIAGELESKTPKLSSSTTTYDNHQTCAGSVSSSNNANTIVQVCESSCGHYEGKASAPDTESSSSSHEDSGIGKVAPKIGKSDKNANDSKQEDKGNYGGKCSSDGSKKGEGGDSITKYKWDRLTRSQTGKSPQAVSYSTS